MEPNTETTYDGPTLRAIRESLGIPLRQIARTVNMSHGHLSKVERGEHGRPITPAILAAYEKVTKVSLADAAAVLAEQREGLVGRSGRTWQPGQLSDIRRLAFNSAIGAIAAGGQMGDPYSRLLDSTGRPGIPIPPAPSDIEQLIELERFLTGLDLIYGGELVTNIAKTLLRWEVAMLDIVSVATESGKALYGAVARLAARTAWSAFDTGFHESARSLFRLALFTAVRSGDHDLRAHVLADAAAQHNHIGYHEDAIDLTRIAVGDERIDPAMRAVLHSVQARAYAALGKDAGCRRAIDLAHEAHSSPDTSDTDWVDTLRHPGRLAAATGHALAELAGHTGAEADLVEGDRQLQAAVDTLDNSGNARAVALAMAALAKLHIKVGDPAGGLVWAQRALAHLPSIGSARLRGALGAVARAAAEHQDGRMEELAVQIRSMVAPGGPGPESSPDGTTE